MAQDEGRSWWSTLPGVLTALAALLTALGGLLTVFVNAGLLSRGEHGPAVQAPSASGSEAGGKAVARASTAQAQAQAPGQAPPASPLRLKVKGAVVMDEDGSVVELTHLSNDGVPLTNGQTIYFDRLASVEIHQPFDGTAVFTFNDGEKLQVKDVKEFNLWGDNGRGDYARHVSHVQRIEIRH